MKKILAISLCMFLISMGLPVSAASTEMDMTGREDVTISDNTVQEQLLTKYKVTIDENGNSTIVPYNTDLLQVSNGVNNSGSFKVKQGDNVKIHMYISSVTGSIKVYASKGSTGAYKPQNLKATWKGTGHHYADLFPNADAGTYNVFVYGIFTGPGAVYEEP